MSLCFEGPEPEGCNKDWFLLCMLLDRSYCQHYVCRGHKMAQYRPKSSVHMDCQEWTWLFWKNKLCSAVFLEVEGLKSALNSHYLIWKSFLPQSRQVRAGSGYPVVRGWLSAHTLVGSPILGVLSTAMKATPKAEPKAISDFESSPRLCEPKRLPEIFCSPEHLWIV